MQPKTLLNILKVKISGVHIYRLQDGMFLLVVVYILK